MRFPSRRRRSHVIDETVLDNQEDGFKPIWVFDNQVKSNPISFSTFPAPSDKDYLKVGGHFGPHNVHENRPGSFVSEDIIFATYQNADLRVYDIRDRLRPKEIGAFVPPPPAEWMDPGRTGPSSCTRPTCSSTRTRSATSRTSPPGST